jgi:hypothetical protein
MHLDGRALMRQMLNTKSGGVVLGSGSAWVEDLGSSPDGRAELGEQVWRCSSARPLNCPGPGPLPADRPPPRQGKAWRQAGGRLAAAPPPGLWGPAAAAQTPLPWEGAGAGGASTTRCYRVRPQSRGPRLDPAKNATQCETAPKAQVAWATWPLSAPTTRCTRFMQPRPGGSLPPHPGPAPRPTTEHAATRSNISMPASASAIDAADAAAAASEPPASITST